MKNNFSFIDLFAGIGGFRLALESLGGECVFSSEIDKFAAETYYNNFGDYPDGDITIIESQNIPNHDFLCAGFPCQPFSTAGKRLGFEDSRGTLFFEVARILKEKKPKGFILENVSGLVNHDKGKTLNVILNILSEIGYTSEWKLLNAKDFNIPQNRNRWYCVGVRNDFANSINLKNIFPEKIPLTNTLSKILEKEVSSDFKVSDVAIKNIENNIKDYLNKIDNTLEPIIANNIRPSKVSFSSNGISPCLTAKMGTGGNNVPVIYSQHRKFTVVECLRIMGFPEDYKLKENYSQSYKQLGNSVAMPVVRLIFKNFLNELSLSYRDCLSNK
ncbi:TPA: DNA cytosine methyltransferase [Streptococcus suis]